MAAMNQAKSMTSLLLKPAGKQLLLLIDKKSRMKSWIVQTLLKVFIHSTTYQRRQVRRNQIVLKTTDGSLVHVKKYNCTSPKLASPASCKVRVALGFGGSSLRIHDRQAWEVLVFVVVSWKILEPGSFEAVPRYPSSDTRPQLPQLIPKMKQPSIMASDNDQSCIRCVDKNGSQPKV